MKRGLIALAVLAILLLVIRSCAGPSVAIRQAVRVTVATPEGPVRGTSVQRVVLQNEPALLPQAGGYTRKLTGEAVVVDLGNGRYLFALLDPGLATAALDAAGRLPRRSEVGFSAYFRALKRQVGEGPVAVPREAYPRLVTFADINDPASVALVNPDDLAASFGAGYALERITIEITRDPVTEGVVEGVLGWWSNLTVPIGGTARRPYGHPLYALGKWDFVKE